MDWLAAINGRLGVAYDRALFYAIGGAAWGGVGIAAINWTYTKRLLGRSPSLEQDPVGLRLGAGVEYAFTPNWVGRIGYCYYGFGNYNMSSRWTDIRFDPGAPSTSVNTVRIGLAYLFSAPAPVVAKY